MEIAVWTRMDCCIWIFQGAAMHCFWDDAIVSGSRSIACRRYIIKLSDAGLTCRAWLSSSKWVLACCVLSRLVASCLFFVSAFVCEFWFTQLRWAHFCLAFMIDCAVVAPDAFLLVPAVVACLSLALSIDIKWPVCARLLHFGNECSSVSFLIGCSCSWCCIAFPHLPPVTVFLAPALG